MPQVTNITVSYERKRQPAQYESAGARVEWSAVLGDNEDPMAATQALLGDVKTAVLIEVGIVKAGESGSAVARNSSEPATPAAKVEPVTKAPAKTTAKTTKAPEPKPEPAPAASNDIPGDDSGPSDPAPAKQTAASAGVADIPDEPVAATGAQSAKAADAVTDTITAEDIHALVHSFLKDGKIDKPTVKKISREKFGVERIADIAPDKLPEYKAALEAAVAAFTGAADI